MKCFFSLHDLQCDTIHRLRHSLVSHVFINIIGFHVVVPEHVLLNRVYTRTGINLH